MTVLDVDSLEAPPPYSSHDPHATTLNTPASPSRPLPSPNQSGMIASSSNGPPLFVSAQPYFQMRPSPRVRPRGQLSYAIEVLPYSRPEEVCYPPAEMNAQSHDLEQSDWNSFLNHLFPYNAGGVPGSSRGEKAQLQLESEPVRVQRLKAVVDEWNEGFFVPRNLKILLHTEQRPASIPTIPTASAPVKKNPELGRALFEVVKKGDVATTRLLLAHGADPDYRAICAVPMITEAVKKGNEEIVQLLLEAGPNLEATAPCDETALYAAIRKERANMVRLLLRYGAQIKNCQPTGGEPPLYLACKKQYKEIVDILLDTSLTPDIDLEQKPPGGCTSLYKAVGKDHTDLAERLLARGAKAEISSPGGPSALYRAVEQENVRLARLLLQNGAKVETSPPGGSTALYHAVKKENREMVRLLLDFGADVNGGKGWGQETPMIRASKKGPTEILQLLLDNMKDQPVAG